LVKWPRPLEGEKRENQDGGFFCLLRGVVAVGRVWSKEEAAIEERPLD
jgi:hypothetical protein